jgi:8-hydroxy-5-deazaflavin:NADPH oxidoreductase
MQTGNVGAALGQRWAAAGHDILFGVRQPGAEKVAAVVKKGRARARAVAVREAAAGADVVVLASAAEQTIAECGNLAGKIVIDCNNPLLPDFSGLTVGHTDSASEAVARWAKGARVVKTLNTTGSGNMLDRTTGMKP